MIDEEVVISNMQREKKLNHLKFVSGKNPPVLDQPRSPDFGHLKDRYLSREPDNYDPIMNLADVPKQEGFLRASCNH